MFRSNIGSGWAAPDPGRQRRRLVVVVGVDVRVPVAATDHVVARRQPPGPDLPPRSPAPDRLRRGTRRPVGRVGIGLLNARDLNMTFQYASFGVPGLGLRRGLADNVVIAPYATGLAAMVEPLAAVHNFQALTAAGRLGVTDSTSRSTTLPRVCRRTRCRPWCGRTWPITRGC